MTKVLWKALLLGAWWVVGCGNPENTPTPDCSPGDAEIHDDQTYCVYRGPIIETRFDCPAFAPIQHVLEGMIVCSPGETLPSVPEWQTATNNVVIAQDVHLPVIQPADGCLDEERVQLSGGDLVAMTNRIVVADVTEVGIADSFAEASSLEDGLTRCDKVAVRLTLKVHASVVENLHGTGGDFVFTIGSGQRPTWASQPRYLFNDQWLPDESAHQGAPAPQILTSEVLGWTGDTGLQAGQRLVLFLNDNGGLTPTAFPMGEVGDDGVISFQGLDLPSACLSMPASFLGMTIEALKAALLEPRAATDWEAFSYPAETSNFCGEALQ